MGGFAFLEPIPWNAERLELHGRAFSAMLLRGTCPNVNLLIPCFSCLNFKTWFCYWPKMKSLVIRSYIIGTSPINIFVFEIYYFFFWYDKSIP